MRNAKGSGWIGCSLLVVSLLGCGAEVVPSDEVVAPSEGPAIPLVELTKQPTTERVMRPITLEKEVVIGGDETEEIILYEPIGIELDRDENIYVLDKGAFQVKKFSPEGALLLTFGAGEGEGPGEFTKLKDFDVLPDGRVLVPGRGGKVSLFSKDGSLLGESHETHSMQAFTAGAKGTYAVVRIFKPGLLATYDYAGNEQQHFGYLIEKQQERGLGLVGWLAWNEEDEVFLYRGMYSGIIASFSSDGSLNYFVETIDSRGLVGMRYNAQSGRLTLDQKDDDPMYSPPFDVLNGRLYTGTYYYCESKLFIDVYDVATGMYQYSMLLPTDMQCWPYVITHEHIYSICEASVVKFSYAFDEPAS